MSKKITAFFTGWWYPALFIFFIGGGAFLSINSQTDTSNIYFSEDGQQLICAPSIKIYQAKNAYDFLEKQLLNYDDVVSYPSMICTIDVLYDGSPQDQETLQKFVKQKLSFWPKRRKDIEEHLLSKTKM